LTLRDRDLISIQEARELAARAAESQKKFATFTQEQVDSVVDACAKAATDAGEHLARMAVEETGYGNVPDKIIKNRLGSVDVHRAIRGMRTVGILREDKEKKILEVATPVGVVAAVIPSTNPTSTAIYKTLISLKARNAIVLSPHPSAIKCICEAATIMARAAVQAGAPEGLINCMSHTTLQGTQELMRHRDVAVILATGGTGLVRAAYSSGKPSYGVGPGNVPAFIERTANVPKAVADIIAGKTFDYGTICSSEQAMVADEPVKEQALEECRKQGAYFLSADEIVKVGALVFPGGSHTPNPKVVGRAATVIAEMAGIKVPAETRVLIARLEHVGREHPLSGEKLSPILAFYSVPNLAAGIDLCTRLLNFGGMGHTCSIHSQNEAAVREFGQAVPAFRIPVNTSSVHGSIGYSTNLFPAMTLGCGAPGGNITSDNIGPQHLMNIKRIAWESRAVEHRTIPADKRLETTWTPAKAAPVPAPAATKTAIAAAAATTGIDRSLIARVVEHVMAEQGIARGSGAGKTEQWAEASSAPTSATAATVIPSPAAEIVARVFGDKSGAKKTEERAEARSAPTTAGAAAKENPKPAAPAIQISPFVSENDVRVAITRQQKIFIGPKTILTPSARDLGGEHEIFVDTST
jgi:acetaldehyde dehydrogenase (acetylating)